MRTLYACNIHEAMVSADVPLSRKKMLVDPLSKLNFMDFQFATQDKLKEWIKTALLGELLEERAVAVLLLMQSIV
jgi:hypothetical protein